VAAVPADERVGVLTRRQEGAASPEPRLEECREAPRRRAAAGEVAVEARDDVLREAAEQPELVRAERGPERRDDLGDPRLRERDHVEVSLDADRAAAPPDPLARLAEPVERVTLPEERGLRRVEVLGRPVRARRAAREDASTEADHLPGAVGDRERDALAEPIE